MPIKINMRSIADSVKGQGVGSCFLEQVNLVTEGLSKDFEVYVNKNVKADILHFHTVNIEYYLERLIKAKHISAIGYVHFIPETIEDSLKLPKLVKKIFYKYLLKFYNSMDYLVVVNPSIKQKLNLIGVTKPEIIYIPNYVSNDSFYLYDKNVASTTRDMYNIDKDKFVVLGVGQLQTRKGIVDFVEVAKKLPDVLFLWAGGFSFGKITDGYKEIKAILENPPPNIRFLDIVPREEMPYLYNIANLMFLPSFDELFPMTILEAVACNTPLLLRDIEIYDDILFDFYLRGKSVDEFSQIISNLKNNLVEQDKAKAKSKLCNDFYSKEKILLMWEKLYFKAYKNKLMKLGIKDEKVF